MRIRLYRTLVRHKPLGESYCERVGRRYTPRMPKGHIKEALETQRPQDNSIARNVKDVSNALSILEDHRVQTNPFGGNVSGENSYRRAERIASALHLVTNHIADHEPLRASIRSLGVRLLERMLELRSGFRVSTSERGQSVLAEIREGISLVRLLAISGYISTQNAQALVEALDDLGSLIVVSQRSNLAEQVTFTRAELTPPVQMDMSNMRGSLIRTERVKKEVKKDSNKHYAQSQGSKERGERIMDILRSGGVLGIKDISVNLPQYSEKMIQRELVELVEGGKVVKTGEKRWSRYEINSAS